MSAIRIISSVTDLQDTDGSLSINRINGASGAPQSSLSTGAGGTATISVSGTDLAGIIEIKAGSLPVLSANIATITYNIPYKSNSFVQLYPANAATALLSGVTGLFINSDKNGFTFVSGTTALTTLTTYKWFYHIIGV